MFAVAQQNDKTGSFLLLRIPMENSPINLRFCLSELFFQSLLEIVSLIYATGVCSSYQQRGVKVQITQKIVFSLLPVSRLHVHHHQVRQLNTKIVFVILKIL